jgi:hypothetical protein
MSVPRPDHVPQGKTLASPRTGTTPTAAAEPRGWLGHFPPDKRSTIANWFHYAVRAGAQTPEAVCRAVVETVQRRLQAAQDPETDAHLMGVRDALYTDPASTLAYAASVLAYERLPYDARQRVKAERALHFLKDRMGGKAVTAAQLSFLHALGYRGAPPEDRAAASALIDALRRGRGTL